MNDIPLPDELAERPESAEADWYRRGFAAGRVQAVQDMARQLAREIAGGAAPDQVVRNDCAFCGRERSAKDDNHDPACPYWTFFPAPGGPQ